MNLDRHLIQAVSVAIILSYGTVMVHALSEEKTATHKADLRDIRVVVFEFDVLKGVDVKSAALADQINAALATLEHVTLVNRDQLLKVADEHKLSLAGVVDNNAAAKLGEFLTADYAIVGRASRIGQTNYVVIKVIDVNTTVQTTIAAKAPADTGVEGLLEKTSAALKPSIRALQKPIPNEKDATFNTILKAAKPLVGKVVILDVSESHVNRPLPDPAAQTAIYKRLTTLGMTVIIPQDPVDGWKQSLLESGKYGETRADFLLEGEGLSAFATNIQGMVSCRARVELRLVPVPGNSVIVTNSGAAAHVDLVEALAAKAALADAGTNASDELVLSFSKFAGERQRKK